MATIYKFQDSETNVTSTTTTVLSYLDSMLMYSAGDARTRQTKLGGMSGAIQYQPVTTSTSTATALPNQGIAYITSLSSAQFFLSTPTGDGQMVTLFNSSSTSTGTYITTNSTASANFISTGGMLCTSIGFSKTGAYAELVSRGSNWLVTGLSAAGVQCT